jgi:hypothetical protein
MELKPGLLIDLVIDNTAYFGLPANPPAPEDC